jgi:hypothetical protein
MQVAGETFVASYSFFSVDDEKTNYALKVGGFNSENLPNSAGG